MILKEKPAMTKNLLVPAAAVLALLSPAAARAQGYHWLQQPWHLKTIYLTARVTTIASSSEDRPAFLKEAHRVINLLSAEEDALLTRRFRAYLDVLDAAHAEDAWDDYRVAVIKAMSDAAFASSNTPSKAVFFARFDDLIFAVNGGDPHRR